MFVWDHTEGAASTTRWIKRADIKGVGDSKMVPKDGHTLVPWNL